MANLFSKAWNYFNAWGNHTLEEKSDPKIQIQQAIEEVQKQHQRLSQQAAAVIGNQRQLELKLNRELGNIEALQANARQALQLADKASAAGDTQKAGEYTQAAESFASQLVTTEANVEDLKKLHDQAIQAAGQAKAAVERNAAEVQQKLAERTKLLSQLEQAKMQEEVSKSLQQVDQLAVPGSSPSLDQVREKIEKRYSTALGAAELAQNSVAGRIAEVQHSTRELAGQQRLEQIRQSLYDGQDQQKSIEQ